MFCAEERTDFMTKKKIFTIAGIAVGAVIVIGIVIWLIFFRGGSVAPSDPNEMVYVTSVAARVHLV